MSSPLEKLVLEHADNEMMVTTKICTLVNEFHIEEEMALYTKLQSNLSTYVNPSIHSYNKHTESLLFYMLGIQW